MKRVGIEVFIALTVVFCCASLNANPFTSNVEVRILPGDQVPGEANFSVDQIDQVEEAVVRGLNRAGEALDNLGKKLNEMLDRIDRQPETGTAAAPTAPSTGTRSSLPSVGISIERPGTGTTQTRIQSRTQHPSSELGGSFKNFFTRLGDMFKALGRYAKSVWEKLTGPSIEEAPIRGTLNEWSAKLNERSFVRSAQQAGQATKNLGIAIAEAVRSLFN